jgi:hypothetical protein
MSDSVPAAPLREMMRTVERRYWDSFIRHMDNPMGAQEALLRHILDRQGNTTFGRKYGFKRICSFAEYRRAFPIHSYEELRPYIEAQDLTGQARLNAEQPNLFAQTSGTTGQPKYIPILKDTRHRIRRYQRLFALSQYRGVAGIFSGDVLVLSGQQVEGRLPTGTAYGSMSGLLFEALPSGIKQKDVLTPRVRELKDVREKYWHVAACALAKPSLSVMAAPNPSTFLKLMEVIRGNYLELLDALSSRIGRAGGVPRPSTRRLAELKEYRNDGGRLTVADLWPSLKAVVTWMGGNCGVLIPKLKPLLPAATALIEMGYLSSECLGSLNVDVMNNRCVLTFQDNLFEFVPLSEWETADPKTLTLDQVEVGEKYQVVVTTPAGLYRYAMNDIVEVTGRFSRTPTIRFVQKGKGVTNITGEKLYEHHVTTAIETVCRQLGFQSDFYIMLADVEAQEYTLYIESPVPALDVEAGIERAITELNVEFNAKRESGRLNPLVVRYLYPGAAEAYRNHCLKMGQRESQFKLVKLQYRHDCTFDFSPHLWEGRRP